MVRLVVEPRQGNVVSHFPYTGFLGLTPVSFHGHLRTHIEEDQAHVEASSVQIRIVCYESETRGSHSGKAGQLRALYSVSKTLWKPSKSRYGPLGDFEANWRLVLPADAPDFGATSSMTFKSSRIWWSLEGIIHHKPSGPFGTRIIKAYPIHLVSFAYPRPACNLAWDNFDAPELPLLHYQATTDSDSYGPGLPVPLALKLKKTPRDPTLSIKKVTVELRRQVASAISLPHRKSQSSSDSNPSDDSEPPLTPTDDLPALAAPEASWGPLTQTPAEQPDNNPYFSSPSPPSPDIQHLPASRSKIEDVVVTSKTLNGSEVYFDQKGEWSSTIVNVVPQPKSNFHWSTGETCNTGTLSVRFYISVKVTVKSRHAAVVTLPPRDINFQSVTAEDRAYVRDYLPKLFAAHASETMYEQHGHLSRRCASSDNSGRTRSAAPDGPQPALREPRPSIECESVVSKGASDWEERTTRRFSGAFPKPILSSSTPNRRTTMQPKSTPNQPALTPSHKRNSIALQLELGPPPPIQVDLESPSADPFAQFDFSRQQPAATKVDKSRFSFSKRASRLSEGPGPMDMDASSIMPSLVLPPRASSRTSMAEERSSIFGRRRSDEPRFFNFLRRSKTASPSSTATSL